MCRRVKAGLFLQQKSKPVKKERMVFGTGNNYTVVQAKTAFLVLEKTSGKKVKIRKKTLPGKGMNLFLSMDCRKLFLEI